MPIKSFSEKSKNKFQINYFGICFLIFGIFLITFYFSSCKEEQHEVSSVAQEKIDSLSQSSKENIPDYLKQKPELFTYNAIGNVVDAPKEDQAVAATYPHFKNKGDTVSGTRITLLTRKLTYLPLQAVRIIHVQEILVPGQTLYVMGPKTIGGEYINDSLATKSKSGWADMHYDGMVLDSPGVDYNFEITEYHFAKKGTYRIQWKMEKCVSNILEITVM